MAKFTERHVINDSITLFKQDNSKRWYTRFKVENTWYTRATKENELGPATVKAIQLHTEFQVMINNQLPIYTTRKVKTQGFSVIADLAIQRMKRSMEKGGKSKRLKQYIAIINNYLKPFFSDCMFREIDEEKLVAFDEWRTTRLGKVPAKDTVKDHNVGLQRVLDEAVIQKCITQTELPELINKGRVKEKRSFFTKDEFAHLVPSAKDWIEDGRTALSRNIRLRLYYYMQIAGYSGIRPGTEMDELIWDDFSTEWDKNKKIMAVYITVRKGKTTDYTGTRRSICKNEVLHIMENMILALKGKNAGTDKVFGDTKEFGKNFTRLLKKLDMKRSAHGERTIYSLRHSYITWELLNNVPLLGIARQCGTSPQMITDHYAHISQMDYLEDFGGKHAD